MKRRNGSLSKSRSISRSTTDLPQKRMRILPENLKLYALTDPNAHPELSLGEQVEQAIAGGATCIQLREKDQDRETFLNAARGLVKVCNKHHVPLIINDDLDIALDVHADGVHLGQEDLDLKTARQKAGDLIIGISAHSVDEAVQAWKDGAHYLGSGALFATSSKSDVSTLPVETFKAICKSVPIPVVGIGGVDLDTLPALEKTGMAGPAIIHGIFGQPDITRACQNLIAKLDEMDLQAD